jgi:hypothetical protein
LQIADAPAIKTSLAARKAAKLRSRSSDHRRGRPRFVVDALHPAQQQLPTGLAIRSMRKP